MGCFNSSGFISKLPIRCGDRVVCFIGLVNQKVTGRDLFTPDGIVSPFFLPVRGKYDDYGSVTKIDRTPVVDLLDTYSGMDIESLLKTIERCLYGKTIKDNIEYWKNNEKECNKYKQLQSFFENYKDDFWNKGKDYTPVLMMEHERIYDQITKDFVTTGWWYNGETPEILFNKFCGAIRKIGEVYEAVKDKVDERLSKRFVPSPFDTFGHGPSYLIEKALEDIEDLDETTAKNFEEAWDELSDLYTLMSSESVADTMGFFTFLSADERLLVYDKMNEEFARFYKLWIAFCRGPIYFGFSQTAGMQEFDYDILANIYDACHDYLSDAKYKYDNYIED